MWGTCCYVDLYGVRGAAFAINLAPNQMTRDATLQSLTFLGVRWRPIRHGVRWLTLGFKTSPRGIKGTLPVNTCMPLTVHLIAAVTFRSCFRFRQHPSVRDAKHGIAVLGKGHYTHEYSHSARINQSINRSKTISSDLVVGRSISLT